MIQRTWWPRLNPNAQLAKGLVFAGLGGGASTLQYADSSLYGNHGTLTNMDPATDWVFDPTLGRFVSHFGGSNEWITTPRLAPASLPSVVSFWLYLDSIAATSGLFTTSRRYQYYFGQWGDVVATTGTLRNFIGDSGYVAKDSRRTFETSNGLLSGKWYHCVFSAESLESLPIYVDGVAWDGSYSGTGSSYAIYTDNIAYIGRTENSPIPVLVGKIADFLVYNRVLSPAEIQQLADPSNVMLSGLILPPRRTVWPVAVAAPSIPEGSANLSAIADLAATGYMEHIGSATLAAQADIAAVGYHESAGTATLSAVAGMEAVGYIEHCGTATLVAAAGIEAVGHATHYGDATLSAIADLTAIGYVTHAGHAVLSAIADITATGEAPALIPEGSAVLSAVASIDATGYAEASGHAVLSALADMAAVGEAPVVDVPQGYAVLDAVADMAAEGYAEHTGYAVLSAVAGITAVGEAKGGEVPSTVGKTADGLTWADVDGLEWSEVDGLRWWIAPGRLRCLIRVTPAIHGEVVVQ